MWVFVGFLRGFCGFFAGVLRGFCRVLSENWILRKTRHFVPKSLFHAHNHRLVSFLSRNQILSEQKHRKQLQKISEVFYLLIKYFIQILVKNLQKYLYKKNLAKIRKLDLEFVIIIIISQNFPEFNSCLESLLNRTQGWTLHFDSQSLEAWRPANKWPKFDSRQPHKNRSTNGSTPTRSTLNGQWVHICRFTSGAFQWVFLELIELLRFFHWVRWFCWRRWCTVRWEQW